MLVQTVAIELCNSLEFGKGHVLCTQDLIEVGRGYDFERLYTNGPVKSMYNAIIITELKL